MSCYFPIPPNFLVDKSSNSFVSSSITVLNYPSNFLKKNYGKLKKKDLYFSIYSINNQLWNKVEEYCCSFGETIEMHRHKITSDNECILVAVPSINKNNPEKSKELPVPDSVRLDKSLIAERASFNFKIKDSSTYYQGEYPYKMTTINKGTFATFDSLRLDNDEYTKTYLLTMNISKYSANRKKHLIEIYDPYTQKVDQEITVESNSFKHNLLTKKSSIPSSFTNLRAISCNTSIFIPLFLSCKIDNNFVNLTVEHTHPPGSFYWGEKRNARRLYKKNWVRL